MSDFDRDAAAALFASTVPRSSGRPSTITAAWSIVFGWGAVSALAAAGALVVTSGRVPRHVFGPGFGDWISLHFIPLVTAQLVWGILTIVCGLGIRFRQRWSRRAGQALMLLWAVANAALGIAMAAPVETPAGSRGFDPFFVVWRATALASAIMWCAAAGVPVFLLAKREVREWFQHRPGLDG